MYRRAFRLAELNRREAVTDALTGLANRRALLPDLEAAPEPPHSTRPLTLATSTSTLSDACAGRATRFPPRRIDGTGYPDGLRGEQIPLGARIIFVCDAFDAMISRRPDQEPLSPDAAVAELRRSAGAGDRLAA